MVVFVDDVIEDLLLLPLQIHSHQMALGSSRCISEHAQDINRLISSVRFIGHTETCASRDFNFAQRAQRKETRYLTFLSRHSNFQEMKNGLRNEANSDVIESVLPLQLQIHSQSDSVWQQQAHFGTCVG